MGQDDRLRDPTMLEIVSRWTRIPVDTIMQATIAGADPSGRVDVDDLNRQQDFWVAEGLVTQRADLQQLVDYRYLDAALASIP